MGDVREFWEEKMVREFNFMTFEVYKALFVF